MLWKRWKIEAEGISVETENVNGGGMKGREEGRRDRRREEGQNDKGRGEGGRED